MGEGTVVYIGENSLWKGLIEGCVASHSSVRGYKHSSHSGICWGCESEWGGGWHGVGWGLGWRRGTRCWQNNEIGRIFVAAARH